MGLKNKIKSIFVGNGAATNSLYLMFVSMITTIIGIVVSKLLSVNFSLEEYGTYSQALLVSSTVASFTILGLSNATNYFYNRLSNDEERNKYISTIFTIQRIIGFLSGVIIVCLRNVLSSVFHNDRLPVYIVVIAFTPVMNNLLAMYQTLFVSIGKAKTIAFRNFAVSLTKLVAVIFAAFVTNNIVTVLVVILAMDIVQVAYFHFLFGKYRTPVSVRKADYHIIPEILRFCIPLSIYTLTGSLSNDLDKYVVAFFADTEALAIYTNAAKRLPFDILTASFITILIPIITRFLGERNYSKAKDVFKLYLQLGYVGTFVVGGGALVLAKPLMCFLYDEKYLAGLSVFAIYIFIEMLRFANITIILTAAGKTKILMIVSIIELALNAVCNVFMYRLLGIAGPALTTLFLTILTIAILLRTGAKELRTSMFSLFDWKKMLMVIGEIVLIALPINYFSALIQNVSGSYSLSFVISYLVYFAVIGSINAKSVLNCIKELNSYR